MRFIAMIALTLVAAAAQAGDVYKWKDKDGKVHYGDRPKPDAQAVELLNAPAAGEDGEADPDAAKNQAARAAECQKKKDQLAKYKAAGVIKETDNLGQTREYTPAEREKFIAMSEKQVAVACGPAPPAEAAETESEG